MLASGAHWARKLDLGHDAKLFDLLDKQIRRTDVHAGQHSANGPGVPFL